MQTQQMPPTVRLAELYAPIAADLERCQQIFRNEVVSDQGYIAHLCGHVGRFHGKLLRPALLLLTARACGRMRPEHPVLAAVVEMVHIASLVHDDVLDEADVRRRAATVNRLWGNERAVLMGDFLVSHAFHLCSSLGSPDASRVIGATMNKVCEGEIMQVANRDNFELTEAEYLDIISRKTASLIGACSLLGAKYAGADEDCVARMQVFGESMGVAFQIMDDVLDMVGDEAEVGKSLGRDVDLGKLTLPTIHLLRSAAAGERAEISRVLRGDGPLRRRRVAEMLRDAGSIEYAREVARRFVDEARQALNCLPPSDVRDNLSAAAEFVLTRTR